VRVSDPAPPATEAERKSLNAADLKGGWRLACRSSLPAGAWTVEVPPPSRAVSGKTFGPADLMAGDFERAIVTGTVSLDRESLDTQLSLLERVARASGRNGVPEATPGVVRDLADLAASGAERIRVVWDEDALRCVGRGDSTDCHFGVAIDLGTTSVAMALIDLRDGSVLAIDSALNGQTRFGADVISRITHVIDHPEGLKQLREAAAATLRQSIDVLRRHADVGPEQIVALSVVGNPTMQHLLAGISPVSLGHAPYIGAWRGRRAIPAAHLHLDVHRRARLWLAPMVRSNVGGDTVAGMLAAGMDRDERLRLLIDLGTNAEVVLGSAERRLACSTAAGPAFEGANISQGMRAARGAVDYFAIHDNGEVALHVIGEVRPRGICGSGLIDLIAELLRAGAIDGRGWLRPPEDSNADGIPALRDRIVEDERGHNAFVVAPADQSEDGRAVRLTAGDVRQFQLVKGSIAAGVELLCRESEVEPNDIEEVLIAGAFGNFIRKSSALEIGLVPPVAPEKVRFIGNAAGIGARLMLADREARRRALALADTTEYVELAGRPDYQEAFAMAMLFDRKAIG
jgi:uncharacterized 2Fe-2S/4Fe-4S cluster protein (DUF4445 family)